MNLQTQIDFNIHRNEKTAEGTETVQSQAVRLGGNCAKLIKYWQKNNIPLSEAGAREFLKVANLVQRCYDLRKKNNVVILTKWDSTKTFKLYYLGCQCATPRIDTTGCYLHSEKLKIA